MRAVRGVQTHEQTLSRSGTRRSEPPASLRLYTKQDVADLLSISIRSLERLINHGEIETLRMGPRAVRIRASSVEAYLERCSLL